MSLDPTTPVLDSFNRANENPLSDGGNWLPFLGSLNGYQVLSNQLKQASSGLSAVYRATTIPTADQEAYVTVVTPPAAGNDASVFIRGRSLGSSRPGGYSMIRGVVTVVAGSNNDTWKIQQILNDGSSVNTLATASTTDLAAGDKIMIRIIGDRISLLRCPSGGSWTEILTYYWTLSNASFDNQPGVADTYIGIWTNDTTVVLDDVGGGAAGLYSAVANQPYPISRTEGGGSGVSSFTINKPPGTVSGDLLLLFARSSSGSAPAVSGFSTLITGPRAGDVVLYKVAGGSEPASYTVTGSGNMAAALVAYRNSNAAGPLTDTASVLDTSHDTSYPAPSLTTSDNGDLLVMAAIGTIGSSNFTEPAGWTRRVNAQEALSSIGIFVGELRQASAGAAPSATATSNNAASADASVYLIAINGVAAAIAGLAVPQIFVYHDGR